MPTHEEDGDELLDPVGVPGGVADVRVAQRGDRHGHPVRLWSSPPSQPSGPVGVVVVVVAHRPRSPIQKQMRARPPTPMSRATKPSATGPTPPSANPPGLVGCWMLLGDVGDDVAHLGVGEVAREARACWPARCGWPRRPAGPSPRGSAATGRWCRRPARRRHPVMVWQAAQLSENRSGADGLVGAASGAGWARRARRGRAS